MAPARPDRDSIAHHLADVLRLLNLNAEDDPELAGTPDRVAELWSRLLGGAHEDPPEVTLLSSPGDQEDMILVRDMPFHSTCAHHLTPFFGTCSVAYIPGETLVGIGAPATVIEYYARRPQIQERLGEQVASHLARALEPRGVIVHLIARHLCMELHGARTSGVVETTATRGWFSDKEWRNEFFERLIARRGT